MVGMLLMWFYKATNFRIKLLLVDVQNFKHLELEQNLLLWVIVADMQSFLIDQIFQLTFISLYILHNWFVSQPKRIYICIDEVLVICLICK